MRRPLYKLRRRASRREATGRLTMARAAALPLSITISLLTSAVLISRAPLMESPRQLVVGMSVFII